MVYAQSAIHFRYFIHKNVNTFIILLAKNFAVYQQMISVTRIILSTVHDETLLHESCQIPYWFLISTISNHKIDDVNSRQTTKILL